MVRYDGGWGRSPGRHGYDDPYRPYGPPGPMGRPGGSGRSGFRPMAGGYDPDFVGWGPGQQRGGGVGEGPGSGWEGVGEEFWEEETVYGPARYGLGPYYDRLRRQRRSDDELRDEVEEALFYDTWVDADAIRVEVSDGIVTLRGELPDYDEIRYATDDAWDVEGVRGVRSELTIRGEGGGTQGGASQSGARAAGTQGSGGGAAEGGTATAETGGEGKKGASRGGRKKAKSGAD